MLEYNNLSAAIYPSFIYTTIEKNLQINDNDGVIFYKNLIKLKPVLHYLFNWNQ